MDIIGIIDSYSSSDRIAHIYRESNMSYMELKKKSDALACFIIENYGSNKEPVLVYGHKEHLMLVSFLACIKAGHPYIPVDISMAKERIEEIIISSKPSLILNVGENHLNFCSEKVKDSGEINKIIYENMGKVPNKAFELKQKDTCYIIYTSGSTGRPKGVQITLSNLDSFLKWGLSIIKIKQNGIFMNQAPFSFDLSVMDLYLSLISGSTLFSIDKQMISNMNELFDYLRKSNINIWVSTPSFAEMCLASGYFNEKLLPKLKQALFCGEILSPSCVKKLHERFNNITVTNCYGPTEATVAISSVDITEKMCENEKTLPVGVIKQDCSVIITENKKMLGEGEKGEILIVGDSVGIGYYNDEEKTKKSFFTMDINGKKMRGYRTGDEGYVKDDMLYYSGRIDFQIKFNGYRIELEDIENNLRKIPKIKNAVAFPVLKNERVQYLAAMVVLSESVNNIDFALVSEIKEGLKKLLPDYMIPRKIIIKELLPMNANGKINRKLLMEEL